jgi:toxin ParE1/3/4
MKKSVRVRWSARARDDLLSIGRYIALENPRAAREWVEKLRMKATEAAQSPRAGRRVPEINRDDIRETLLRSYRIVYKIGKGSVEVITVFEGHRLLPDDASLHEDE